jgi:hypothetical protein
MTAGEPGVTHSKNARGKPLLDLIEHAWPNSALSALGHSKVMTVTTASVMITSSHAPAYPPGGCSGALSRGLPGRAGPAPAENDELAATRCRLGGPAAAGKPDQAQLCPGAVADRSHRLPDGHR